MIKKMGSIKGLLKMVPGFSGLGDLDVPEAELKKIEAIIKSMTKLSIDEVTKIASLARIALSSRELDELSLELSSILNFVEQLQQVDTSDETVTSQVTGLKNVTRKDEVKKCSLSREELLANAPLHENGFVKVKRVL